jgi:hypothetical protein
MLVGDGPSTVLPAQPEGESKAGLGMLGELLRWRGKAVASGRAHVRRCPLLASLILRRAREGRDAALEYEIGLTPRGSG